MHIWNLELAAKKDDCQFGASGFLNGNAFEAIFFFSGDGLCCLVFACEVVS